MRTCLLVKKVDLIKLPWEIILLVVDYLDTQTIIHWAQVCKHYFECFELGKLSRIWKQIQHKSISDCEEDILHLSHLSNILLFDSAFRKWGSSNEKTKQISSHISIRTGHYVLQRLLEDTFRSNEDDKDVEFLLQNGADIHNIPCGLNKLLEDTFRRHGPCNRIQLLLQSGAGFEKVPCGFARLLEDTFRGYGDNYQTRFLLTNIVRKPQKIEGTQHSLSSTAKHDPSI